MSEIAIADWGALPRRFSAPVPDQLFDVIRMVEEVDPAGVRPLSPREAAVAEKYLATLRSGAEPVTAAVLHLWVAPVIAATAGPRSAESIPGWLAALELAMAGVPRGAFTQETQKTALRALRFWPTPADIWEIVRHDAAAITGRVTTLEKIIATSKEATRP